MEHENGSHKRQPPSQPDETEERRPDFIPARPGRMVSLFGLIERIVEEFKLEHGEHESDAMKATTSVVDRRKLVRDVAEYIMGVESVQLSAKEQARVMARAYGELFGYGPLDEFLLDEQITTVVLEGVEKISVRRKPGAELEPLPPIFEDNFHLQRTVGRILRDANAELREDIAIIEAGLRYEGRRIALNVATPPTVIELTADIRLHPLQAPTLDDLTDAGFINANARDLLRAIARSEQGFIIVGDAESGKTTLLNAMLSQMPAQAIHTVERAGELTLPSDDCQQWVATWRVGDDDGVTFGARIQEALDQQPDCVVLDEVRADEPLSIAPLLNRDDVPRQVWSFRGASDAKRIRTGIAMLARMADRSQPEAMVYNVQARLPFLIIVKRRKGYIQLREIAEWQLPDTPPADEMIYADYVPLMEMGWDDCELTGKRPQHALDLPDEFWEN